MASRTEKVHREGKWKHKEQLSRRRIYQKLRIERNKGTREGD